MSVTLPKGARVGRTPRAKQSNARFEDLLAFQMKSLGLPTPEREYRFALSMKREWRFYFAFVPYSVAVECEGLVVRKVGARFFSEPGHTVVSGRHASITGMREDIVKYNSAILLGWSVLRFEQTQVNSGEAVTVVERVLVAKGWHRESAS